MVSQPRCPGRDVLVIHVGALGIVQSDLLGSIFSFGVGLHLRRSCADQPLGAYSVVRQPAENAVADQRTSLGHLRRQRRSTHQPPDWRADHHLRSAFLSTSGTPDKSHYTLQDRQFRVSTQRIDRVSRKIQASPRAARARLRVVERSDRDSYPANTFWYPNVWGSLDIRLAGRSFLATVDGLQDLADDRAARHPAVGEVDDAMEVLHNQMRRSVRATRETATRS